jgi:hypothetical protein
MFIVQPTPIMITGVTYLGVRVPHFSLLLDRERTQGGKEKYYTFAYDCHSKTFGMADFWNRRPSKSGIAG